MYRRALEYLDDTDPYIGNPETKEKIEVNSMKTMSLPENGRLQTV